MTATAEAKDLGTVVGVSVSSPADQPEPATSEGVAVGNDSVPELQLLGPPAPPNRRRQVSTVLLLLGALLLVVAIILAL